MRQLIIARKDLQMSPGKLAAQCCHASLAFLTDPIGMGQGVFAKMLMDEGVRVLDAGELPEIILKNEDGKCQFPGCRRL